MPSTPDNQFVTNIAQSLAQFQSGDALEVQLRQRHPLARYRAPHPVFKLSSFLLLHALESGAAGLKLSPSQNKIAVCYEVDGVFQSVAELPRELSEPLVARFKDMAAANVMLEDKPQNGSIPIRWQEKDFDAPTFFEPGEFGEQVTLHFAAK